MTISQKIELWFDSAISKEIEKNNCCHFRIELSKTIIDGIELEADEFNLFFPNGNQIVRDDSNVTAFINGKILNNISLLEMIEKAI